MLNQSQALLNAIKEYETNKWKVIGAKVGKPAKVSLYLIQNIDALDVDSELGLRTIRKGAFRKDMTCDPFSHMV